MILIIFYKFNKFLYNHHFLIFWQVFLTLLVCFLLADQKMVYCQLMELMELKEFLVGSLSPLLNESTNNLLIFESIR